MAGHAEPWPIEQLVLAQRMACDGNSFDDIAAALGRPSEDIRRRLEPDPKSDRPKSANVGYPHMKPRR